MDSFPDSEAVKAALALVLQAHRRWDAGEPGGVRLNLTGAYMRDANLACACMHGANLSGASLACASMREANLAGANLNGASMREAFMGGANLTGAYIAGADMTGANLAGAYIAGADMTGTNLAGATLPHGIVRSTAPQPAPEPAPAPAERRRIEWFKRYENPNGTLVFYAGDQDGRVWWLILSADAPDTWTEVTPLPTYQEQP